VIGFRLQGKVPDVAVFPDAPEDILPVIVLADPLQASLHEALDVSRIQVQFEVEDLTVIAVIVPDSRQTREDLSTSLPSLLRQVNPICPPPSLPGLPKGT
jgi:hypothetical protein